MLVQKKVIFALSFLSLCFFTSSIAETWAEYALCKASEWGCTRTVSCLLRFGVDPKANNSKIPALITASENGHADVVDLLLQAGAADGHKEDAELALCKASEAGHARVVETLLEANVDPTAVTQTVALIRSAANGHVDVIKLLPEKEADRDKAMLALMIAAKRGDSKTVEAFLRWKEKTIDINGEICEKTALLVAMEHDKCNVARLLLNHGATPLTKEKMEAAMRYSISYHLPRIYPKEYLEQMEQNGSVQRIYDEVLPKLLERKIAQQKELMNNREISQPCIADRKAVLEEAGLEVQNVIFSVLGMTYGDDVGRVMANRNQQISNQLMRRNAYKGIDDIALE